jgi:DNA (cytosine-5)-methyltransferase 1
MDLFSFNTPKFVIDKPVRLIEMFAGIGAQAKALENLGVDFEHWFVCEIDKFALASYNAIHGTNLETKDITKVHAAELKITEREKYCYILTYSFPCQDLSLAGKQKGMSKGSSTRSGLLWEVERILDECVELPQVLLMENVPQVIGTKNIKDFQLWRSKLEKLGYSNYVQLLNAKNYGIPQNRNRCFMVSILGKYHYSFPHKKKLKLKLKDLLEDKVDDKYYLSDETVKNFVINNEKNDLAEKGLRFDNHDSNQVGCIEKGTGQHQSNTIYSAEGCSRTIQATDWKDPQLVSHAK